MSWDYPTIRTELRNGVLWATLDNPPLNLIDEKFVTDLIALLDETEADDSARVVVFRSADPDFFVPHVDIQRIPQYTAKAATSGGPDDISLGALYRRLSEARSRHDHGSRRPCARRRRGVPLRVRHAVRLAGARRDRAARGGLGHLPGRGCGPAPRTARRPRPGDADHPELGGPRRFRGRTGRRGQQGTSGRRVDLLRGASRRAHRTLPGGRRAARQTADQRGRARAQGGCPRRRRLLPDTGRDESAAARFGAITERGFQERSLAELELGAAIGEL
ncbi:hypothetical protein E4K10_39930 [Streptomyces sp. T1317-0309]|nr:hypothetical protein E4K10_39930 [Streptomyces sp. T1317-0309]